MRSLFGGMRLSTPLAQLYALMAGEPQKECWREDPKPYFYLIVEQAAGKTIGERNAVYKEARYSINEHSGHEPQGFKDQLVVLV